MTYTAVEPHGSDQHGTPAAPAEPAASTAVTRWPRRPAGVAYGGDYNPEQWPAEVWVEDVRLMREAGVNLVSVGIFSWAQLEPAAGQFDFGWLDRVLDLLHGAGIAVDLATPTAAPPAWFRRAHPESRLVDRAGNVLGGGARQSFCPSSVAYADASARITEQLALRYRDHPALVMWHAHNEYGGVNAACYCPESEAAFRRWLQARYSTLDGLNQAWSTAFWGQRYGDWEEIEAPHAAPTAVNPTQELDFLRFSSDAHLECFRRERDLLHRLSAGVPVTTNFMIANCKWMDYWQWAREVDVVSNDHYLQAEQPDNHIELAMAADLTRSVASGRPWLLMEHSTSAVNWQPRNLAKRPGELRRNTLSHIARGADGALFFQWRAARAGAEKFHSAMLPHGGTENRIWQEVVELGAELQALAPIRDSQVLADLGMVWDWQSWWALELPWRPSCDLDYRERMGAYYAALWRAHQTVDFVHPEGDLTGYPLVVVPSLYLTTPAAAANLTAYVRSGGTLIVSYFSGIVDADDAIHPGGHPGALRDLLGVTVEEFLPLRAGESVTLDGDLRGDVWAERLVPQGAETILSYCAGPAADGPAITRHQVGDGMAWYVSTSLHGEHLDSLLRIAWPAGRTDLPAGVEVIRRAADGVQYIFAINHSDQDVTIAGTGIEQLTDERCGPWMPVPAGAVRVLREELT